MPRRPDNLAPTTLLLTAAQAAERAARVEVHAARVAAALAAQDPRARGDHHQADWRHCAACGRRLRSGWPGRECGRCREGLGDPSPAKE